MARRIQRLRKKGWQKPEGAIYVGRPTQYGNPFRVGVRYQNGAWLACLYPEYETFLKLYREGLVPQTIEECLELYKLHLETIKRVWGNEVYNKMMELIKGHDLMCWCNPSSPCHADILIELANK